MWSKMRVSIFFWGGGELLHENISLDKKEMDGILSQMCLRLHVKYPLVLSDFNLTDYLKIFANQFSRKFVQGGGELFYADVRTDRQSRRIS